MYEISRKVTSNEWILNLIINFIILQFRIKKFIIIVLTQRVRLFAFVSNSVLFSFEYCVMYCKYCIYLNFANDNFLYFTFD